jgi:hypothetical protein
MFDSLEALHTPNNYSEYQHNYRASVCLWTLLVTFLTAIPVLDVHFLTQRVTLWPAIYRNEEFGLYAVEPGRTPFAY